MKTSCIALGHFVLLLALVLFHALNYLYTMDKELERLIKTYTGLNLSQNIDYDKFNYYAIVHHSSSIEGSTLTEIETQLLLDEGLTPTGKPLEHSLMTKDHFEALQFILLKAKNPQPLGVGFIQILNGLVMKSTGKQYQTVFGEIDGSKGDFRKGNVSAGNSYFVNFDKVEGLTKSLVQKVNERLKSGGSWIDMLNLSFDTQFDLLTIHPFYDGNGRTARLLMNYIQLVNNLPLSIVYKEDKVTYYQALVDTREKEDIGIFRTFMVGQYKKYLVHEIEKHRTLQTSNRKGPGYSLVF
ncbi:MAG: Fic family protein [Cyclobacteriaceae bacterium]|nr:Fic family protein [Cyclobacteriaceae bacterium]